MLTRSGLLSAQLRVTIPDAADVVATVANVTLPLEALVALPSMIFGSALRFTEPPPNMWLLALLFESLRRCTLADCSQDQFRVVVHGDVAEEVCSSVVWV